MYLEAKDNAIRSVTTWKGTLANDNCILLDAIGMNFLNLFKDEQAMISFHI